MDLDSSKLLQDENKKLRFKNCVVQYLNESNQLEMFQQAAESYQSSYDDSNRYQIPFRHNVFINFTELAELSSELANILLLEPHFIIYLIKSVIHSGLFIVGVKLNLDDVVVNMRINLPELPELICSSTIPTKNTSGLFIIRGILIAITTPYKYVQSTVFECPMPDCDYNTEYKRVYGVNYSYEDIRCSLCNISKVKVPSAEEVGERMDGVLIDCDSLKSDSFKCYKGTSVIFKDDLCKDLIMGAEYAITVCFDCGSLAALGVHQVLPDPKIRELNGIPLGPIPLSIQNLIQFLSKKYPESPWALSTALSSQLASHLSPRNCFLHLKAGILLSLASQRCESSEIVHLFCMGSEGKELMDYCGKNLANRLVNINAFASAGESWVDSESNFVWLESGPLLMAYGGICYLGDWSAYKQLPPKVAVQIKHALELGQVKLDVQRLGPCSALPTFPLQCSVWANHFYHNRNIMKQKSNFDLKFVTELFGMPFIGNLDSSAEIKELAEQKLNYATGLNVNQSDNGFNISNDDLKKYLDFVSTYPVTVSHKASQLLRKYFVASRRCKPGCLPQSAIKVMTALSKAQARIGMRKEVTEDDVVFIIYLYEKSITYLFGPSLMNTIDLKEELSSQSTIFEQVDANLMKFSEWLESSLKSLVNDGSIADTSSVVEE